MDGLAAPSILCIPWNVRYQDRVTWFVQFVYILGRCIFFHLVLGMERQERCAGQPLDILPPLSLQRLVPPLAFETLPGLCLHSCLEAPYRVYLLCIVVL